MKLENSDKKLNRDLKKLIKDNGTTVNIMLYKTSKKSIAQNILKNQRFITKYKNLDAQLQNTQFQYLYINVRLQQMVTMDQMKNVMMGLGNIMGSANGKLTMKDFTNSMKTYQT